MSTPAPAGRILGKLQDRIVLFFVALLMAVQLASFYLIRFAIERTAQDSLRQELQVGARVFQRQLEQGTLQRVESASVLTSDYGVREAIATQDRDTVLSAMSNHGARIRADSMAVVALDGTVFADTQDAGAVGRPYPFPDLINEAASRGRTWGARLIGGKPFQVIVVPVLAPVPIAWVSIGFRIGDAMALDLQRLTTAEVTFVGSAGSEGMVLLASTLPPPRRAPLMRESTRVVAEGTGGTRVALGNEDYEVLAVRLEGTGSEPIYAILARSVTEGLESYQVLQVLLLFLAGFSLAITVAGAVRIAKRITQPVAELAEAARQVARGNYAVDVQATGSIEITELANAFRGMTRGLAERDNMRDVLGKVASNSVAEQLLSGQIELGGEEREATVIFTDVRNFTALAETLTPTQSLQLLNEFLTAISAIVEAQDGVVDKYLGDGVMAVFGAPIARADDPQRALEAALSIRDGVRLLGLSLKERGLPHPEVGVGLNTSRVIAGNIGSPTRLNYTVLGDGVNLASRLEGLTKRYQVPIVAGELTRERVTGIVFRELDKVRVRGKSIPVRIFEPLGREGSVSARELELLAWWHAALEDFRARRFSQARTAFVAMAEERAYSRVAQLHLGYLNEFEQLRPGADWDGAFTLYEK